MRRVWDEGRVQEGLLVLFRGEDETDAIGSLPIRRAAGPAAVARNVVRRSRA